MLYLYLYLLTPKTVKDVAFQSSAELCRAVYCRH